MTRMQLSLVPGLLFALLAAPCLATPASAAAGENTPQITAAELAAGEEGYGLTVMRGESVIRFPVKFIGILQNAMASQDIVLIRLTGEPFQHTGVIAGMSGSPIYFRDRLLGALAYGWGFSKDPIAGVTPIANMLRLVDEHALMDTTPLPAALSVAFAANDGGSRTEEGLRPLAAPLSVAGLGAERRGEAWKRIDALGFQAAAGGRVDGVSAPLVPGSAVGIRLVDGDLALTAIGTVTWVDGRDVLAFGHPFLNRGFSRLPMTGARIETVLPSLQNSFKLGSSTDDLGALLRDGAPGISGRTGPTPTMIPLTVDLSAPWGGRGYRFRVARDDMMTMRFLDIAWASAAEDAIFAVGPAGVEVKVAVTVGDRTVTLRDRGVVENSVLDLMPTLPVQLLYDNPFGRFHPDSVAVTIHATDDRRRYEIETVRPRQAVVKPGDTLVLDVTLLIYDVGRRRVTVEAPVPPELPDGNMVVLVSGGRGLYPGDLDEPRDLNGLLDRLAAYEPHDMLVTTMLTGARGLAVEGGFLPGLPPGLRRLQSGQDRPAAGISTLRPMDAPVFGAASAAVEVRSR